MRVNISQQSVDITKENFGLKISDPSKRALVAGGPGGFDCLSPSPPDNVGGWTGDFNKPVLGPFTGCGSKSAKWGSPQFEMGQGNVKKWEPGKRSDLIFQKFYVSFFRVRSSFGFNPAS